MLEDIRTYARTQLAIAEGMTRSEYIAAVVAYAAERHGEGHDVRMHAERTARHMWASER